MTQVITLPKSEYDNLKSRISRLEILVGKLVKRKSKSPKYGSEEWWDKETKEAIEEMRKGNVAEFDSLEELLADLHS